MSASMVSYSPMEVGTKNPYTDPSKNGFADTKQMKNSRCCREKLAGRILLENELRELAELVEVSSDEEDEI